MKINEVIDFRNIKFIRYGGLSPVKQRGYDPSETTFHSPPARRGIYAFPEGAVEPFLLGSRVFDPRRMRRLTPDEVRKVERIEKRLEGSYTYPRVRYVWPNQKMKDKFDQMVNGTLLDQQKADEYARKNQFMAKDINRREFTYTGNIWSHLDEYIDDPTKIIKRKAAWVLTDFDTWREAYKKALVAKKVYNYSKDHLEVFIERP